MILVLGWPILLTGSLVVLHAAVKFYRNVQRSVLGRLVFVMVVGWLVSMYSLGITATAYMLRDPQHSVPFVVPIFAAWAATMGLIAYAVRKWSAEVVTLNGLYTDLEGLVEQRTHALAESLSREQLLEKARTDLLSIVAHDMVTPLTTIGMELHSLKRRAAAADALAFERLERNLAYVTKLVNDVRDLGRMQAGRLTLSIAEMDLTLLVRAAAASFEARAAEKDVVIEVDIVGPVHVRGDSHRLSQVLYNLVANALKFTPRKGRVTIETRSVEGDAVVTVRDSGRGLDAADLTRLFEPFSPGPTSPGPERGTGLGLYICKGIVEQHGGRIWAESDGRDRGSAFAFRIPKAEEAPPPVKVHATVAGP